jgi:AcrR family transcriptional regulator
MKDEIMAKSQPGDTLRDGDAPREGENPEGTRGSATRARILEAAQDLFTERGFDKVPLREVAEAVGITKAALYYYFPTKEKILESLVGPLFDMQEAALALLESPPDPKAWAVALASFLDWILEQRKLFELMQSNHTSLHELMHQSERMEQHQAMHERVHQAFADESVPLATRVRLAGAVMFVIGVVAFPAGGPFAQIPSDELRPAVLGAINDLLLPRQPSS